MPTPDPCSELMAWSAQYPVPSAHVERNGAARIDEDNSWPALAGLAALDRGQVTDLIGWKFQGMTHRKALALRGISPERWEDHDGLPGAAAVIRRALASSDDYQALATMAVGRGIYRFGPAMSTVVLAACQRAKFTVADSRALRTLRRLGLMPLGRRGSGLTTDCPTSLLAARWPGRAP